MSLRTYKMQDCYSRETDANRSNITVQRKSQSLSPARETRINDLEQKTAHLPSTVSNHHIIRPKTFMFHLSLFTQQYHIPIIIFYNKTNAVIINL